MLNQLPTTVATALFGSMLKGADFVTSNVPGVAVPGLPLRAPRLERCTPSDRSSGAAANITLLSHCGTCCIGVNIDTLAIPDADEFADGPCAPGSTRSSRSR